MQLFQSISFLITALSCIDASHPFIPRRALPNHHRHHYHHILLNTSTKEHKLELECLLVTPPVISQKTCDQILNCRGGGSIYDDEYDEYDAYDAYYDEYDPEIRDEDDEHGSNHKRRRNSRPPPHRRGEYRPPPRNIRPPQGRGDPRRWRQPQRPPQESASTKILKTTSDIAQKSLNMATTATVSTLKNSGRAAYYLAAPKYVQKHEIYGIWRFDQIIGSSACAANIEFTVKGDVITRYDGGEENITGYLFRSRTWPRSCYIEFEAEAFQGASDDNPVKYYYRGYFRRKMADKSVIKIVGKIYEVKKRFWQGKDGAGTAGEEVGSFVARKRMKVMNSQQDDDEEYEEDLEDDEYDDYYDEYDEEFDQ